MRALARTITVAILALAVMPATTGTAQAGEHGWYRSHIARHCTPWRYWVNGEARIIWRCPSWPPSHPGR